MIKNALVTIMASAFLMSDQLKFIFLSYLLIIRNHLLLLKHQQLK